MKTVSRLLLVVLSVVAAGHDLHSQPAAYHIPAGVTMATAKECHEHNDDFLKASNYLIAAPMDAPDRLSVDGFVLLWMKNTGDVKATIDADLIALLTDNNGELMMLHMMGWARYALNTGDTAQLRGNLAGLITVLKYYQDPMHKVGQSAKLDHLAQLQKQGKLVQEVIAMMNVKK